MSCPYMYLFLFAIFLLICYMFYEYITKEEGRPFTYEELKLYNGKDKKECYVGVKNIVFDVSGSGKDIFY